MKKLLEAMEENQELKAKIEELDKNPESTPKDYVQVAAEYGIELKDDDLAPASGQGELNDDELDAVAGGGYCGCAFAGGGSADSVEEQTCACVVGGGGEYGGWYRTYEVTRCACVVAGTGLGW